MQPLVRKSGATKQVGETSQIYLSRHATASVGEEVPVTDAYGNLLNIALVTDVDEAKGCVTIEMIA